MSEGRLRRIAVAWTVVLALVFAALAGAVDQGDLRLSDHLLLLVAQAPGGVVMDWAMALLSLLGTAEVTTVAIIAFVVLLPRRAALGWRRAVPLAVFGALVLLELLGKDLVHQVAPPGYLLRGPRFATADVATAFSFPSGHASRITLVVGLVALRLAAWRRSQVWLWAGVAFVWILCYSRVYLGEHWPADVAGGILLGGIGLALCLALAPRAAIGDWEGARSAA